MIGCIIQARLGSTRLPGKVLKKIKDDVTVLEMVIRRVKQSKNIEKVVVATTLSESDDALCVFLEEHGLDYYRGSENDVLNRYFECANHYKFSHVVRVTSDCPCIDANVIDRLIDFHLNEKNAYSSNIEKRTYPHGMDVEIVAFEALKDANDHAIESFEREHVMPYVYVSHKDDYRIGHIVANDDEVGPDIRITVDTESDYMAICALFEFLHDDSFTVVDIVELYKRHKWLSFINNDVTQKGLRRTITEEIDEAILVLNRQQLNNVSSILEKVRANEN